VYFKWFSTPEPAYHELVTQLYGDETGARLYRTYRDELSNHTLWAHRMKWAGVAVYEAGQIRAHAVVQVIQDKPLVYVGYVECVNDAAPAALLVQEIRTELRHKHPGRAIYLPVNQSIWHTYRFKTRGDTCLPFDPPCQPFYGNLFARLFETRELYSSYRMAIPHMFRLEGIELPYAVRELSTTRLPQELRTVYDLSRSVFQDCHSLPSFAEFAAIYGGAAGTAGSPVPAGGRAQACRTAVGTAGSHVPAGGRAQASRTAVGTAESHVPAGSFNPRYILLAEAEGMPIGFIFAFPLGQAVYIKTLGVVPSTQNRHVGRLLFESICRRARADGYEILYGLLMKNDRLITQLLPPDAEKVAEYTLYRGG
jgi:GNAT superfamily N-acetyltransferase